MIPRPYLTRQPGDLIRASDWNEVQRRFREELAAHDHTGGERGPKLSADSLDPDSTLRVRELRLSERLVVAGEEIDLDRADPRGGQRRRGLRVGGDLRVLGELRYNASPPERAPLRASLSKPGLPAGERRAWIELGLILPEAWGLVSLHLEAAGPAGVYCGLYAGPADGAGGVERLEVIQALGHPVLANAASEPIPLALSCLYPIPRGGRRLVLYLDDNSSGLRALDRVTVRAAPLFGGPHV